VDGLSRCGERFVVTAGSLRFKADNVVVAMATHQAPWVPPFAAELDPGIVQLHAGEYRNPSQLRHGGVLVVGTGNSGAEIALDVAAGHPTWLSGRDPHVVPFRIETAAARHLFLPLVLRVVGHHVLTVDTPLGRKLRPEVLSHGAPLVRVKPKDIAAAGIERVPKTVGVRDGLPLLEDQRDLDVANVIWCTGFLPDFSWIDLPVVANEKEPLHERGIVSNEPGLYFVGLHFLYALSSATLPGVGRDAERVVEAVAARVRAGRSAEERRPARPPAPSRLIGGDGMEDAMTTQELGQTTTRHPSPRTG
jgi:putative flavoprotein involved in K+ transport